MAIEHDLSETDATITTTLSGTVTYSGLMSCFQAVDKYLADTQFPMVFWVIDAKNIQMSYSNMIQVIEATSDNLSGTGGDPRVIPLLVVDDYVYDYLRSEMENRYVWTRFPNFETVDEAISFIQYINYLQQG